MSTILFLDIDGVLNTNKCANRSLFCLAKYLHPRWIAADFPSSGNSGARARCHAHVSVTAC